MMATTGVVYSTSSTTVCDSSDSAWTVWTSGTSSGTSTNVVWQGWVIAANEFGSAVQRTAEQLAAIAQNTARIAEEHQEHVKKQKEAKERALDLLRSLLTDEEYKQLQQHGSFLVVGSDGRRFKIAEQWSYSIKLLNDDNTCAEEWCAVAAGVPLHDQMATLKLALENNVEQVRSVANVRRLKHPVAV